MTSAFISHDTNANKLLKNCWKNILINKQVKCLLFVLNKFIAFSEYIWILLEFSYIFEDIFFKKYNGETTCVLLWFLSVI